MCIHLHIQSAYSLLTSTIKLNELVSKAKANGFSSLALTDRNVMYGAPYFYKECLKQGIKPIIGLIADILDEQGGSFPLLLLAKNNRGYSNLLKISSAIQTKSQLGLPIKWLKAYSAGLFAISPGSGGKIELMLSEGKMEEAKETVAMYQRLFGIDSFYLSLQRLLTTGQDEENNHILTFAREVNIDVVATNPVFYLEKNDALAQEVLLAIKNGSKLTDEDRMKLPSQEYYLKNAEQLKELFRDVPDILDNTRKIAESCHVEIPFNRSLLPKFPVPNDQTADDMLEQICLEGLKQKRPDMPSEYIERLHYELHVIKTMKFSDYFLIVWDFMKFAKKERILTGPGRGSSAGSMVAYVLSITNVDPIEHQLLFERFLNPERVTMPDIDIDFPDNRRDEVIAYVAQKYGEFHVAQIITFGTLAAKAALRDTGRVFGLSSKEQEALSKSVPAKLGITLNQAYTESKRFRDFIDSSELYRSLYDTAIKLEGLPRHTSTHAAGVVISDQPLTEIIAIQAGHDGIHLTQFPMDVLEEIGLLKMDFLGLRNLTLIDNITKSIKKRTGRKIDMATIPLQDEKTYALLSKGETTGIFQFESEGITNVLVRLKPSRFEDIVAVNALYRPGPMDNIPLFIERKHGLTPIEYAHQDLQAILQDTYGVIVYQEQIMQIASKLAGFSLGEADLLRRAVSKKNKDILDQERTHFVSGSVKLGYKEEIAHTIYDMIVRFANYGFPRSHAVAYSFIAYQLAYLKAHHPTDFMAALLTSAIGNDEKIAQYLKEAKKKEIVILPPSINKSFYSFTSEKEGIRYSLAAIKSVGGAILKEIFAARREKPFYDIFDFCLRVSTSVVNRKVIEMLIHAGAFDEFEVDRATLLASLDVAIDHSELVNPNDGDFDLFLNSEFSLKPKYVQVDPIRLEDKLIFEKKALGLYLSEHPIIGYKVLFQYFGAVSIDEAIVKKENKVLIGVYISSVKAIRTKKGEVMAFIGINDEADELEAVVFPNVYKTCSENLMNEAIIMVQGRIEERNGKTQMIIDEVYSLDVLKEMKAESTSRLFIKIPKQKQTNDTLRKIKQVLAKYKGMTKVMLYYESENRYVQLSLLDWVVPNEALIKQLAGLIGKENVVLKQE
ncbi:DNA polymerase III subunit alpha [Peribacillus huizhouensis]|uniref:DNA polymerase III subunit alpha n=1 Tax=Peribacillus huizhouensis TaxID=1501239 RepID=A0ABR6CLK1_9BACI|nr:DNA polymerase III subunit alpha [Peribacillus huizhouensis]MBA9025877.1 DNA polymerase-3 subunit alpha [Peribacillus huizhouensis]